MNAKEYGVLGIILAFAGGAVAGAAAALLLAPATGIDTRDQLKRFASDTRAKVMDKASDLRLPFGKRKEIEPARNGAV